MAPERYSVLVLDVVFPIAEPPPPSTRGHKPEDHVFIIMASSIHR